jgi:hypothetical protein
VQDTSNRAWPVNNPVALIHGQCAAGPLVIDAAEDEPGLVHLGWPRGGMWLTERQVGKLIAALVRALEWPPDPDEGVRVVEFDIGGED